VAKSAIQSIVSEDQQSIRHMDRRRLRGGEIDDQVKLGRPYDGHLGGLLSLENPASIDTRKCWLATAAAPGIQPSLV
jgi:hypothetical protein